MSLLVVGALHWDVVVRAPRLPELDETLRGQEVAYQFGGKGGNQAIAAAKAGAPVNFAGRIGADAAGKSMLKQLETAGVDVSQLQRGLRVIRYECCDCYRRRRLRRGDCIG